MKRCFECEKTEDQIEMHDHHVVPKSRGGTKTIPLCYACHAVVHDKKAVSIKELTKAALKKKRENGLRYSGKIPFGYMEGHNKKLIENPEEQLILSTVRDLRLKKRKTWKSTAEILNDRGLTNRAGGKWKKENLYRIFRNKIQEEKQ